MKSLVLKTRSLLFANAKYLKYVLLLGLTTFSIADFAQPAEKNFIDQNYIEVSGKAEMQVVPDLIYLKIVLSEKDNKNRIPIAEMEKKMSDKLQELGIDLKKDLSVNDQLSRYRGKLLAKADIVLSKEYQVMVHDARTAGKVFSELEEIDISNVSISRLDHTKMEEFRKEVKINAIKAAREKGEYLTRAVNQNIGRALFIQEANTYAVGIGGNSNAMLPDYYSSGAIKEPYFDFEKIKLEHSILVRFELK